MKRGTPDHPKMKHLARALNINRAWAVGIMESLWHWAGKFAQQGDIGRHEDVDIAEAVYWRRDPKKLMDALVSCGWVDTDPDHRLLIHDWQDHADNAVRKWLERNGLDFIHCRDRVQTESGHCPDGVAPALAPALALASSPLTPNGGELALEIQTDPKPQTLHPEQIRLNALFRHTERRRWSPKELKAWRSLTPIPEDELSVVERYFSSMHLPDKDYRPRSLGRLLNDWNNVVDRATAYSPPSCL